MFLIFTTLPLIHFDQKKRIWRFSVGRNLVAQIDCLMKVHVGRGRMTVCLLKLYTHLQMLSKIAVFLSLHLLPESFSSNMKTTNWQLKIQLYDYRSYMYRIEDTWCTFECQIKSVSHKSENPSESRTLPNCRMNMWHGRGIHDHWTSWQTLPWLNNIHLRLDDDRVVLCQCRGPQGS